MSQTSAESPLTHQATIPARLRYIKDTYPNSAAFVFFTPDSRQVTTFGRLYHLAARFARRLIDRGFQRGDVIANTLVNSLERLVTDLGIIFAGCIPLNGQIVLASGEDFFQSAHAAKCRGVVVRPDERSHAWTLLRHSVSDHKPANMFVQISCESAEDMTTAILVRRGESDSELGSDLIRELLESDDVFEAELSPQDLAYVFTTSGSTGFSKLVPRTHQFLFDLTPATGAEMVDYNVTHDLAQYNDRPLGWLGGFPFSTLTVGTKRLILDQFYEFQTPSDKAALTWRILREESIQIPYVLPLDFYHLLHHVGEIDPDDRVAIIGTGSQPIMKSLVKDMLKITKTVFLSYGSTEASIVSYKVASDVSQFQDFSAGKPLVEKVRIVDKNLQDCRPGEIGTIWVKTQSLISGYYNPRNPDKARPGNSFLDDGWFNMEDSGYLDDNGELFVLGRAGDVITQGAHQVYPGWLEKQMSCHPDVTDVAVVPVSDPVMFQEICACVLPSTGAVLTEESLRQFANDVLVSDEEITPTPKYFLILKDFPKTSTGKVNKKLLANMAEEKFGKLTQ